MRDTTLKKWMPFQALTEQGTYLSHVIDYHKRCQKPILSEEQQEEINYILTNYLDSTLIINYYDNYLQTVTGKVSKLDVINRLITINDIKIKLDDVTSIVLKSASF